MKIIQNAVKITEGRKTTYLISRNRHHYNQYQFKNGATYAVDGGQEYFRRCADTPDKFPKNSKIEDWCLTNEDFIDEIRNKLLWGTFQNKKRTENNLVYLPIKDLTLEHLNAILLDVQNGKMEGLNPVHLSVIKYWAVVKYWAKKI